MNGDGVRNLAPFSFFGGVTAAPPTVMASIGRRRGVRKDTSANLLASGEGVVHIPTRELAEAMVASSAEVEDTVDEFDLTGLATVAGSKVGAPRLVDAAIAMEVRVAQHLEIGAGPIDTFFLEIVHYHIDDRVLVDGRIDPARLAAVGRLGGAGYCDTAAPFDIARPG